MYYYISRGDCSTQIIAATPHSWSSSRCAATEEQRRRVDAFAVGLWAQLRWDEVDAEVGICRVKPQDFLCQQVFLALTAASWHRLIKLKSLQWAGKGEELEELLEVAHLAAIIGVLCHPQDGGKGSEIEKEMKRDRGERKERSAHLLCWDIAHLSALEKSWR